MILQWGRGGWWLSGEIYPEGRGVEQPRKEASKEVVPTEVLPQPSSMELEVNGTSESLQLEARDQASVLQYPSATGYREKWRT